MTLRDMGRAALLFGLLFISTAGAGVAQQAGTVEGRIGNAETGAAMKGVQVVVEGTRLGASSERDGTFRIEGVPAGEHALAASLIGYHTVTQEVVVRPGVVARVSLELSPSAVSLRGIDVVADAVMFGKGTQRLREIPQSVSLVSRQQMNEWDATTMADALAHVVGITIEPFGNGVIDFSARGFGISAIQVDGLSTEGGIGSYTTSGLDMAAYERIEVQRGPAGLFQGSGEPGGTINLVRKRALSEFAVSGAITAGSWQAYRAEVDVTGPLTRDGALRGRVVGAYDDRGSYMDHVYARKPMVYGTLEYSLTPRTIASIGASYQGGTSRPVFGLPAYDDGRLLDVPRSTYLGSLWDRQTEDTERYFVDVEHRFANGGEWRLRLDRVDRFNALKYSSFGTNALAEGARLVGVNQLDRNHRRVDRGAEWYATFPVRLISGSDNLMFGLAYRDFEHEQHRARGPATTRDVFTPDPGTPEPTFTSEDPRASSMTQRAVYGQVRLRPLSTLTVIGGGRFTEHDADPIDVGEFVPHAGLVYDVTRALSAYASYSSIFEPQTSVDRFGEILPPRSGDQVEAGLRGELRDGRLTAHAAVFQITDRNRAVSDPEDPLASIALGEVRSRGFEVEVAGRPYRGWQVTGGYAFTDAVYRRGTDAEEGTVFSPGTPRHALTLWSRYEVTQGRAQGVFVGGGLRMSGGVFAESGGLRYEQDAYAVVSAHAGYRISPLLTVQVTGENLSDTSYYSRVVGGGRQNYYGAPRSVQVTLRMQR